jgi:hypothetical protein
MQLSSFKAKPVTTLNGSTLLLEGSPRWRSMVDNFMVVSPMHIIMCCVIYAKPPMTGVYGIAPDDPRHRVLLELEG